TNWLDNDLNLHPSQCVLAYFHRPLFSSGEFAAGRMRQFWEVLYKYGADVVVNGHEHFYAAFQPMAPSGAIEKTYGIRQLIAGTGGARLFDLPARRYGERMIGGQWGVLKIDLERGRYSWEFIGQGEVVLDSGVDTCHPRPPAFQ